MSRNILELFVDSIWDCGVTAVKMISKVLGLDWSDYDFQKFFNVVGLKNSEGISPKLKKKKIEDVYKVYIFDVPMGLSISDFNSKLDALSFFMKTNKNCLCFECLEDLSGIKLKVLCFNEFFRLYELKNDNGVYPKFIEKEESDVYNTYIFNKIKGITIDDFKKKFINFPNYLKIENNKLKYTIEENDELSIVELRIYK